MVVLRHDIKDFQAIDHLLFSLPEVLTVYFEIGQLLHLLFIFFKVVSAFILDFTGASHLEDLEVLINIALQVADLTFDLLLHVLEVACDDAVSFL